MVNLKPWVLCRKLCCADLFSERRQRFISTVEVALGNLLSPLLVQRDLASPKAVVLCVEQFGLGSSDAKKWKTQSNEQGLPTTRVPELWEDSTTSLFLKRTFLRTQFHSTGNCIAQNDEQNEDEANTNGLWCRLLFSLKRHASITAVFHVTAFPKGFSDGMVHCRVQAPVN